MLLGLAGLPVYLGRNSLVMSCGSSCQVHHRPVEDSSGSFYSQPCLRSGRTWQSDLASVGCARAVAALGLAGQGRSSLQQLVLVVADGRFHEREALQRAVREVGACA